MGRLRFVQPGTVRLELADVYRRELAAVQAKKNPKATKQELQTAREALADAEEDGAWLQVKAQLNAGEAKRSLEAAYDAAGRFGMVKAGFAKLCAYIVDWSFLDAQGESAPVTPGAIDLLDTETYQELIAAVEWHDAEVERRRQEQKKTRHTERPRLATSDSPSAPGGLSSTSAH